MKTVEEKYEIARLLLSGISNEIMHEKGSVQDNREALESLNRIDQKVTEANARLQMLDWETEQGDNPLLA